MVENDLKFICLDLLFSYDRITFSQKASFDVNLERYCLFDVKFFQVLSRNSVFQSYCNDKQNTMPLQTIKSWLSEYVSHFRVLSFLFLPTFSVRQFFLRLSFSLGSALLYDWQMKQFFFRCLFFAKVCFFKAVLHKFVSNISKYFRIGKIPTFSCLHRARTQLSFRRWSRAKIKSIQKMFGIQNSFKGNFIKKH